MVHLAADVFRRWTGLVPLRCLFVEKSVPVRRDVGASSSRCLSVECLSVECLFVEMWVPVRRDVGACSSSESDETISPSRKKDGQWIPFCSI